jgi:uroporphyrinogen-III synthase
MQALVTRPREDAQGIAADLRGRGLEVMVEPLLDIVPVAAPTIATDDLQGVLATSANGIRALARALPGRGLPVWAVGDATARCARDLGYRRVESAGGDVHSLAALVRDRARPDAGALLHAAGTKLAGDLAGLLGEAGFAVRRVVLYDAHPARTLSGSLIEALTAGRLSLALFFSPRTARTFVTLAEAAGIGDRCGTVAAYALSPAVADILADLPWRAVVTAETPTQAALLAALDRDLAAGHTT